MESKRIVGLIRKNLDEIAQPITGLISLLQSIEESEEKDKLGSIVKTTCDQLDNILDSIGIIYQATWFNLELMGMKGKSISRRNSSRHTIAPKQFML